ncbi:MAG: protein kinase [Planctomycetota bacterium]
MSINEEIHPTLEHTPAFSSGGSQPQPHVGLQRGTKPRFDDETRDLLRRRLFAAAVAIISILGIAFVGNLILGNYELWWLRTLFLAAMGWSVFQLTRNDIPLGQLRLYEVIVFGIFFLQLLLMMTTRLSSYAALEDVGSVAAVRFGYLAAFSILILAYGIFVPNDWKRGSAVIIPMALLPYLVFWIISAMDAPVRSAFDSIAYTSPIPITAMAAAVAIYGTHTINAVRKQAFQARQFGQYRLGRLLGKGGMGQVFEAEHLLLKRPCAIKLIRPENESDEKAIVSFEREVKATAKLTHWNTVEIFDYGRTDDGTFYYVMELLRGMSLHELVTQIGPVGNDRAIYLMQQLCDALDEAHDVGLIHRDLKPANLFVSRLGKQFDVVKLLDFGLVKLHRHGESDASQSSSFSGTPQYMSPEQAIAYESVDPRSDIYAVGCMAYFAVAGQPPFLRPSTMETLTAHARETPSPPSALVTTISPELDQIIFKCLAKEPQDRFQSAAELRAALAGASQGNWDNRTAAQWWDLHREKRIDDVGEEAPTFVIPKPVDSIDETIAMEER